MNYKGCESVIKEFLVDEALKVMSFTGEWGIGKTYLWKEIIKNINKIGLDKKYVYYSYTSLFGITSIIDLKYAIQSNIAQIKQADSIKSTETNGEVLWKGVKTLSIKGFHKFKGLGSVSDYSKPIISIIDSMVVSKIKNYLICIDDFERKSDGIAYADIFGVLSKFKEESDCKIIIIHHEDKIDDDTHHDYLSAKGKVVDIELCLTPDIGEVIDIVFNNHDRYDDLIKNIRHLNIRNIRTLKKIQRFFDYIGNFTSEKNPKIQKQISHSLPLMVSLHIDNTEFSLNDLKEFRKNLMKSATKQKSEEENLKEKKLMDMLTKYGWYNTDKFDDFLIRLIESGLLPEEEIIQQIKEKNEIAKREDLAEDFHMAWEEYKYSFETDANKFLNRIKDAYFENIKNVGISDFCSTYCLFRDLGDKTTAKRIADEYLEKHDVSKDYDLTRVNDSELVDVISAWMASKEKHINYEEVFLKIGEGRGWNIPDLIELSEIPEEELYSIIFNHPDWKHFDAINFFLSYREQGEDFKKIGSKIENVLKRISNTAPINSRRILKMFNLDFSEIPNENER